ncbi:MAG: sugar porter family MFS transporter [Melioribacteraceae bacterium]|nr:sugar porter family MFS transporter [Melioribacteraceae bacterium]
MKINIVLLRSTIIAALGGLLFGFDTAVISGTTGWLQDVFSLSSAELGFTVASALIGTIIGAIGIGKPTDKYGRKKILFVVAILYFVSAVGSAFAWDWYSFLFFRLIGGIGVGGASVVSPMYIAEISPAKFRGRLVAITQLNIVLGMLMAYFSNYFISTFNLGAFEWRWMFGVEAFPALMFFFLLFFTPCSPRWLMAKKRVDEAKEVLAKCGTDEGNIEEEIEAIQSSLDVEHHTTKEPLFAKKYFTPLSLAIAIAIFNQLSGINAVLYYAPKIFEMAGAGGESALLQSVAIGGTFLIFTIAALGVIDHFGRKFLMLIGTVGYIISLAIIGGTFYMYGTDFTEASGTIVLISLLLFVASHAFGQGAVIWVFLSEVFPNRIRARGQALGSFTHWFMAALIAWTFPIIAEVSGGHAFTFYAICMVGQLFWVIFVMPETKGISLEQMQKKFGIE